MNCGIASSTETGSIPACGEHRYRAEGLVRGADLDPRLGVGLGVGLSVGIGVELDGHDPDRE